MVTLTCHETGLQIIHSDGNYMYMSGTNAKTSKKMKGSEKKKKKRRTHMRWLLEGFLHKREDVIAEAKTENRKIYNGAPNKGRIMSYLCILVLPQQKQL